MRSQFEWDIKDNLRFVYSAGLEDQNRESQQDMEQSLNAWDQAFFFLPGTGSSSWMNEVQLQSQGNRSFNWIAGPYLKQLGYEKQQYTTYRGLYAVSNCVLDICWFARGALNAIVSRVQRVGVGPLVSLAKARTRKTNRKKI